MCQYPESRRHFRFGKGHGSDCDPMPSAVQFMRDLLGMGFDAAHYRMVALRDNKNGKLFHCYRIRCHARGRNEHAKYRRMAPA